MANEDDATSDDAVDALKAAFEASPLPPPAPSPPAAFRRLRPLTVVVVALGVAQLLNTIADIVAMVLLRRFLDEPQSTPFAVARVIATSADPLAKMAYLATFVIFCFWVYRAYHNLVPLGARNLRFTPGWAVGNFFIPLVCLVRVPQVMRDLWIESQPLPASPTLPLRRRAPLVNLWWAAFLLTTVATKCVVEAHSRSMGRDDWMALNAELIVLLVLKIVACALFLTMVSGVDRRQREQWDDLVRRQPAAPRDDLLR